MTRIQTFDSLAIDNLDDFIFGTCPKPITTRHGVVLGGGDVVPELNFTLPTMEVTPDTIDKAYGIYRQIAHDALERAAELHHDQVQLEYETTVEFTMNPEWGITVNRILLEEMDAAKEKYGLKSSLRMTVNDNREFERPPLMRSGKNWDDMNELIVQSAKDGADFISIESTGGKEVSDEALVRGDLEKLIFAVGVLGARDMDFLWTNIVNLATSNGSLAASDSACGFANTAMVLAEKGFLARVFAAVVRVALVPRALVAFECGAVGPNKDCGYEGPYIKAITGMPIAAEGRTAAGAHLSQVGNISGATADLWSNESIQFTRLLSDMATTVGMEQLIYDCRLYNTNKDMAAKRFYRDLLVESDSHFDPQAWVLRPDVVLRISKGIIAESEPLPRTKVACVLAIEEIVKAQAAGLIPEDKKDAKWIKRMEKAIAGIPDDPGEFWEKIKPTLDLEKFRPEEYGF
jgi:methanol--5-hydroxybenzimidazolylcobamide Co-methyltransferase